MRAKIEAEKMGGQPHPIPSLYNHNCLSASTLETIAVTSITFLSSRPSQSLHRDPDRKGVAGKESHIRLQLQAYRIVHRTVESVSTVDDNWSAPGSYSPRVRNRELDM